MHFVELLLRRAGIRRRQWYEIDGWFNWRSAQEEAVNRFAGGSRFVEVGTYLGRSLCSLAEVIQASRKEITVIGVDTCRGSGTFAGALHKNILDCGFADKIQLIISDSVAAARLFSDASLDWVHLDARHDYASVKADIEAWLPKLKAGGWLSGDDYNEQKWPAVVQAVKDLIPLAEPWSNQQWRWIVA